jgi:hypothetical protein
LVPIVIGRGVGVTGDLAWGSSKVSLDASARHTLAVRLACRQQSEFYLVFFLVTKLVNSPYRRSTPDSWEA